MQLYNACGAGEQKVWPDGLPLLDQPCIALEMFDLIAEEVYKKCQEAT